MTEQTNKSQCECLKEVQEILKKYSTTKGAVIPILQDIQAKFGYLPEKALITASKILKVPLSRIYGVITFYAQFYLMPKGKHVIKPCQGTACYVRGGQLVLKTLEDTLGIESGATTPDLKYSLESVACLGACALAPVMVVDEKYYEKMTPTKISKILKEYE